jgi:hypothetical protein
MKSNFSVLALDISSKSIHKNVIQFSDSNKKISTHVDPFHSHFSVHKVFFLSSFLYRSWMDPEGIVPGVVELSILQHASRVLLHMHWMDSGMEKKTETLLACTIDGPKWGTTPQFPSLPALARRFHGDPCKTGTHKNARKSNPRGRDEI